jgi:ADP-dependent NAD(P)H-hydrate dehydratase / NAD(P)H-hydrate epimerase
MRPVLTAAQMQEADRRTIEEIGLPGAVLMENAGAAVARVLRERFPGARRPAILCGKGNNGGDGFVVARRLADLRPTTWLLGGRGEVRGDAALHLGAFERSGGRVTEVADDAAWERARGAVAAADVIVDALLGTGLRREPTGLVARAIAEVIGAADAGTPVVAVDLPSGLSSDSGETPWPCVRAAVTVTFGALKHGHVLPPGCDRVGELVVAEIGIPPSAVDGSAPQLFLLEASDAARAFPVRAPGSHKGTYGHLLVVAGSVGKTGAAILAATGALRAGVGLVTVATPETALALVAAGRPELMTEPLPVAPSGELSPEALERALALAAACDAAVIGPGLGQSAGARAFVRAFVSRCPVPLLVDADGLNALGASDREDAALEALRRSAPTVLTPHPGEMGRLVGGSAADVQKSRLETARRLAQESGAVVVLKGQRTIVARADGKAAVNPTGNPGLATGGTGDVLAGIVGALVARHDAWTAATAGVYVHGLAGDRASARLGGPESLLAGDVVAALPEAIHEVGGRPSASR